MAFSPISHKVDHHDGVCTGVTKFTNVRILRGGELRKENLYVRDGKIIDPQRRFWEAVENDEVFFDFEVDGGGYILAPGYIDVQINGAFGVDFTSDGECVARDLHKVSKGVLTHGVTAYLPTLVTSTSETYRERLKQLVRQVGSKEYGASVLGVHCEGPFISELKYGAHSVDCIRSPEGGFDSILNCYGSLDNIALITMAPELPGALDAIAKLHAQGIKIAAGHSMVDIDTACKAVQAGVSLITHLFNAMVPFHHRDPGLVGLLGTNHHQIFYSLIADGIHTHPASIKIAYRAHPAGAVLVTDAISAMGLYPGVYHLGQNSVTIDEHKATVTGTQTLAGSIATMDYCVRKFREFTGCSIPEALEAASYHPAQVLGIEKKKGTLDFGADADLILLNDDLEVLATYIAGELAWSRQHDFTIKD